MKTTFLYPVILILFSFQSFSQSKIMLPSALYDDMKAKNQLTKGVEYIPMSDNHSSPVSHVTSDQLNQLNYKSGRSNGCSCLVDIDSTFSVAEFTNANPPDYRCDDGSTLAKTIPFNFCFYSTNYTQFYINNNGNISFGGPYATFSSSPFPDPSYIMIAPFWADADTRNPLSGLVYYKITPTYVIVQWDHIGYYSYYADKVNTFQVIISDGTGTILPFGSTVAFCYGDMQWTTGNASGGLNGFGGTPATAGFNQGGTGGNYVQLGRFDQPGSQYDGGYGNNDGINFLDNQSFYYNLCGSTFNTPPMVSGINNCDTIKVCGMGDTVCFNEYFLSGEPGQTTTVTVNLNGVPNSAVTNNTPGNISSTTVCVYVSPANYGMNMISYTATDDGIPAQTTTINIILVVDTTLSSAMNLSISGNQSFCAGGSDVLTVAPTTYSSYLWNTGSYATSVTVTAPGNYFVTAHSDVTGCSKTVSTNVIEYPAPTPVIAGYPHTCSGSPTTVVYCDSLIYTSYIWSTSSMNDSITIGNGTYTLTVIDTNNCVGTDIVNITSVSGSASVTANGTTLTSANSGVTYQWIDCSNAFASIVGATNQTYTASSNGSYSVIVSNGICYDTSACVSITGIGINEFNSSNEITISPNPFTSQTTITFSKEQKNCVIKIIDILGKEIKSINFSDKQCVIEKGEMSKGIYFIQLTDENKNKTNKKMVLQ